MDEQNIIAVAFDFDDTLAPDTTSSFLASLGVDVRGFWKEQVDPLLADGWDPIPAYLYTMCELSKGARGKAVTREKMAGFGRSVSFYPGATRLFRRIRETAQAVNPDVAVEFYVISSGIGEIIRHTRLAQHFTDIWACDFHYDARGRIVFPRNIISFTDKTRYLFHISKGLVGPESRGRPFDVNRRFADSELRVPFRQIVYVGDGYTDIPCFSLVRRQDGTAIGVFDTENRDKWGRAWGFIEDDRVSNLVPADYRKDSAASLFLMMAVENIARRIKLRKQMYQG